MSGGHSKEYDDGFKSFLKDPDYYNNPHQNSTQAFNDFERGWTQALKRYPEQKSASSKPPTRRTIPSSQKEKISPEQKKIRNAYKKIRE
ncbi:hypothetical protein [Candidatus Nitrotoga sp. M5]|uniref:hypothetical protein n=1 Tax=Candidatus Nitrotoga sp. M5 TaxID=2890409 RepID=UPI001EF5F34B|nr:hypothetical protein [Candidatus Nitrotoga sp. M5]CAH1388298.1 conserved hypothetical protein [Candidatus Nitrotoga sp. M5]